MPVKRNAISNMSNEISLVTNIVRLSFDVVSIPKSQ